MELIAETDEELMMKFFDGEAFTEEEIQKGLHAAIADDIFVPLVAGNAQTSKGVKRLMDKLVDLMPHPQRAHKIKAIVDGKETEVGVDPVRSVLCASHQIRCRPVRRKTPYFQGSRRQTFKR